MQPAAVVAPLPSMMMTGAQTLVVIDQQQPVATPKPPPTVANAFGETLRAINEDVSIIEALPFPMSTAQWSPKIGVLREVHPCRGLVIDSPDEEPSRYRSHKSVDKWQLHALPNGSIGVSNSTHN
uniref:Uncharacterized protein n=1 Tax=Romanomermis culicivorax TaxID=13658 RepID=A0A915KPM8_ROMCU